MTSELSCFGGDCGDCAVDDLCGGCLEIVMGPAGAFCGIFGGFCVGFQSSPLAILFHLHSTFEAQVLL
jgi:hypothetical protein